MTNRMSVVFDGFRALKQNFTAYDLFALTVVAMLSGHMVAYFYPATEYPELLWLRIFDRAMLPVFLVSVGFNAGRRIGMPLLAGAVLTTALGFFLYGVVRIYVLGTIIIVKLILEPLMTVLLRNRDLFWGASFLFAFFVYYSKILCEFGTVALIFAMAGWINFNRASVPRSIVTPRLYFIFSGVVYFIFISLDDELPFTLLQRAIFVALLGIVLWLLLEFRSLLMNSLKNRPKNLSGKIRQFLGHKSFEIYVIQHVFFFVLYAYIYG